LIVISVAAFIFYEPEKVPARFHYLNAEHQLMLDSLKASGLNWVALLPPHLTGDSILLCKYMEKLYSTVLIYICLFRMYPHDLPTAKFNSSM
jgi:hypothetical protein